MRKVYDFKTTPCKKIHYYDEEMITLLFTTRITSDNTITIEDIAGEIFHLSNYIHTKLTKEFPDYVQKPFYYNRSCFSAHVEIEIDVPISIFSRRLVQSRIDYNFQDESNFEHIYKLKREVFKNTYLYRVISEEITSYKINGNRFIDDLMPETINKMKRYNFFKPEANPLFVAGENVYRAVWMLLKLHYSEGVAR
jgi:hypothetical protein